METTEALRQEIIATLCQIDPHGDWRDDSGLEPLTLQEAQTALYALLVRD